MNRLPEAGYTEYYYEQYPSKKEEQYYYVKNSTTKTNGKIQNNFKKYSSQYRSEENQLDSYYPSYQAAWKTSTANQYKHTSRTKQDRKYFIRKDVATDNNDLFPENLKNDKNMTNPSKSDSSNSITNSSTNSITEDSLGSGVRKESLTRDDDFMCTELEQVKDSDKKPKVENYFSIKQKDNKNSSSVMRDQAEVKGKHEPEKNIDKGFKEKCEQIEFEGAFKEKKKDKKMHSESNRFQKMNQAESKITGKKESNESDNNNNTFKSNTSNVKLPLSNEHKATDVLKPQSSTTCKSKITHSDKTRTYYYETNTSPIAHYGNYGLKTFTRKNIDLLLDKEARSTKYLSDNHISCLDKGQLVTQCDKITRDSINTRKMSDTSVYCPNSLPIYKPKIKQNHLFNYYNKFNLTDASCNRDQTTVKQAAGDNTEILTLKLNVEKEAEPKVFILRRYDNLKEELKSFCEKNNISEKFIKPLEQHVLKALSKIYLTYNMTVDNNSAMYLNSLEIMCKENNSKNKKVEKHYNSDHCENCSNEKDVSSVCCFTDHVFSDVERSHDGIYID